MNNSKQNSPQNESSTYVDLHVHTTASDGSLSPTKVIELASLVPLRAIAITDHDTVSGIPEALVAAKKKDLELVPGIELSTDLGNESVHIVGLYVDFLEEELLRLSDDIVTARRKRAEKMIEKINSLDAGPPISFSEVQEKAHELIGKPHIAEVMLEKGYGKTIDEIFDAFLQRDGPAYVPRYKLTPKQGIKVLKRNGAIPVLAHPGYLTSEFDLPGFLKQHTKYGLQAIEVYYPSHTATQMNSFRLLAEQFNLAISGGSDCHGSMKSGLLLGSLRIPYHVLAEIKKRFKKPTQE